MQTSPTVTETMAKVRVSTNPLYEGGAGGYSFYVRKAEQVVRQRKNNSNYGESASRTRAQMERRVKWGNLVNIYKLMQSWQPKAYEAKKGGQTDYNAFMSLNINRADVALTKDMVAVGCCAIPSLQISRGSLPPIEFVPGASLTAGQRVNIVLSQAISSSTTVGAFSTDVIANNPAFQNGDNIAVIVMTNWKTLQGYPYGASDYKEVTLDTSSTALLEDAVGEGRFVKGDDDYLNFIYGAAESNECAGALIHTRKVNGSLLVSTQTMWGSRVAIWEEFTGAEWVDECIATYGLDSEVPLDPTASGVSISQVTANGSPVRNAQLLAGSQVIRVYGEGLSGDAFVFSHNGVQYTPVAVSEDYVEFILTDNGNYFIYTNGSLFMSFRVQGIIVPSEMTGSVFAYLANSGNGQSVETGEGTFDYCLNFPKKVTEDLPRLKVFVVFDDVTDVEESDFSITGGTKGAFDKDTVNNRCWMSIIPDNPDSLVYMTYKDFIVFVGNYTV